jgi:5-methylcytosine-specific restriction endonuclease McrA
MADLRSLAGCRGEGWQKATAPVRGTWAALNLPCAICHQPIDYTLRHPDRMALTVDHIVPLSQGGHGLDPTNWQPAHHACNAGRGRRVARRTEHTW